MPVAKSHNTKRYLDTLLADKRQAIELALQRFVNNTDTEALHDLRVALRRLTSLLHIIETFQDCSYQQLRHMLKATNRARDLEVFPQIMQRLIPLPSKLEETWHLRRIDEIRHLHQSLPESWRSAVAKLPANIQGNREDFRQLAIRQLQRDILRLQKRRNRLCQDWSNRSAHKLRISGKQVRYILEPFAILHKEIEKCVVEMKAFQDLLGEYNDYTTLLADPDFSEKAMRSITVVPRNEMAHLHKIFISNYCQSEQLEHVLGIAIRTLKASGQN